METSAYGFSSWIEKPDAVAAANLAAADVFPIFPVLLQDFADIESK